MIGLCLPYVAIFYILYDNINRLVIDMIKNFGLLTTWDNWYYFIFGWFELWVTLFTTPISIALFVFASGLLAFTFPLWCIPMTLFVIFFSNLLVDLAIFGKK